MYLVNWRIIMRLPVKYIYAINVPEASLVFNYIYLMQNKNLIKTTQFKKSEESN
jgi:hypothetical protein